MGFVNELVEDLVGLVRDPTDEQKAIVAAIAAIVVVDRYAWYHDIPFVVQSVAAVGAGFIVFFLVSYLITGQFVPPDSDDEE
ncbi:hypothetical protein ACFQAS_12780 [Halopenitus salinus]|jgi:hypothetical protein|uniref:Phage holin family protein n=1 Tax=Halopenitus salinus TaxID=1198295 RepID=A0ABD5V291_9EURY